MCFSLNWLMQICILAIVIIAIVAILKIIIPYALSKAGATIGQGISVVLEVLKIVLWAVVAIIVVILCFELIACLIGYAGNLQLRR